jgi:hypothetical protein
MELKIWDIKVEKLIDDFEEYTRYLDEKIQQKLIKLIATLDSSGGKLTSQALGKIYDQIDTIFRSEFKTGNYKAELEKMHGLVDAIIMANVEIHRKYNKLELKAQELNKINGLQVYKERVVNGLSSAGMVEHVIIPMKLLINTAVTQGMGMTALMHEFEGLFKNGNTSRFVAINGRSLLSWTRQVANDTTNAVNGTIQTHLRDKYDLQGGRYIGNLIRDSRPFCKHMINDEKYPMDNETLDKVLKQYVGNKTKIQVGWNENGTAKMLPKGAGMYAETNTRNFPVVVGGYNCRHRWFAMRLENKK